ncbi:hypothetical protein LXL04_002468 [Taraxacum kok-saghyz]
MDGRRSDITRAKAHITYNILKLSIFQIKTRPNSKLESLNSVSPRISTVKYQTFQRIDKKSKLPAIKQVTGTLGRACRNEPDRIGSRSYDLDPDPTIPFTILQIYDLIAIRLVTHPPRIKIGNHLVCPVAPTVYRRSPRLLRHCQNISLLLFDQSTPTTTDKPIN